MPVDIFQQKSNIQGAWSMDEAIIQFNTTKTQAGATGAKASGLIALGFTLNYQRQITPFRPINKDGTYLVGGRGGGTIQISALIGPDSAIKAFIDQYGDLCRAKNAAENHLTVRPAGFKQCPVTKSDGQQNEPKYDPIAFQCYGCAMNALSLNVQQIGDLSVVQSGISMVFTTLALTGNGQAVE